MIEVAEFLKAYWSWGFSIYPCPSLGPSRSPVTAGLLSQCPTPLPRLPSPPSHCRYCRYSWLKHCPVFLLGLLITSAYLLILSLIKLHEVSFHHCISPGCEAGTSTQQWRQQGVSVKRMGECWQLSPQREHPPVNLRNSCNEEEDRSPGIPSPHQVQGHRLPTFWVPKTPVAEKPNSGEQVE